MIPSSRVDRIYRWQRHVYDWTRPLFLPGRDRLLDGIHAPDGGAVLEIGCGTARNLIRLARRHASWRLYGLDLSASMLRTAHARTPAALRERIHLAHGDAVAWTPQALFGSDLRFDAVFLSYSLSMIPDPRRALERATAVLAPGGSLHVVDFAGPDDMGAPWSWFLPAWLRLWGVRPPSSPGAGSDPPAWTEVRRTTLRRGYAVLLETGPAPAGAASARLGSRGGS